MPPKLSDQNTNASIWRGQKSVIFPLETVHMSPSGQQIPAAHATTVGCLHLVFYVMTFFVCRAPANSSATLLLCFKS